MPIEWVKALLGGVLIGVAVSLMLLLNGRVTGISGIVNGVLTPVRGDTKWRVLFIVGLIAGGWVMSLVDPQVFDGAIGTPIWLTIVAGLLVGFGTIMGSGCTSGHGVCGISRTSPRSLIATVLFIGAGVFCVFLMRLSGLRLSGVLP